METFPRVLCFPKSRINENGGKRLPVETNRLQIKPMLAGGLSDTSLCGGGVGGEFNVRTSKGSAMFFACIELLACSSGFPSLSPSRLGKYNLSHTFFSQCYVDRSLELGCVMVTS